MLDGRYKHVQDRFWDRVGRAVAKTGLSPNQITILGTVAMAVAAATYPLHRSSIVFGVTIAVLELSDNIDGAVARVTGTSSKLGAFLDAATDRYKEVFVLAALGAVHDTWPLAFLCMSGAFLTSYHKARAGMEVRIDNARWPDLFERFERIVALCAVLIAAPFVEARWLGGYAPIDVGLAVIGVLTHLTALQRMWRARSILAPPT